jgi:hypothetical protein
MTPLPVSSLPMPRRAARTVAATLALGLAVALPPVAVGRSAPTVATVTFAAPREFVRKPAHIYLGDSECSPTFVGLRWSSWGASRAVATGTGTFPHLSGPSDSCAEATQRAKPVRVRVVLSRPHDCHGHWTFSRIAARHLGHYDQTC